MNKQDKIYIAGHTGMVGSAFVRKLTALGFQNLIVKTSTELDLRNQQAVATFFELEKPDYVILAAAKVGGIKANNTFRADFMYDNLMIQNNVIHAAYEHQVKKLIFLGSSCIYPKNAPQPLKENYLLTGVLEETNEPYALAKIAGIKLCESYFQQYGSNFISFMPTNMYGLNDNYDLETSHVLPALMRKVHLAHALENGQWDVLETDLRKYPITKNNTNFSQASILAELSQVGITRDASEKVSIQLWGTGEVYREFLLVDDFVEICLILLDKLDANYLYYTLKQSHVNIGSGKDLKIKDLALLIQKIVGFKGGFTWDEQKLDGTYKKCMDVSLMKSLCDYEVKSLEEGLVMNYHNYFNS